MLNDLLPIAFAADDPIVKPFIDVLDRIINWLATVLTVVAALAIVIAAVVYLTAGGNQERVQTANRVIFYAIIAVGVAWIAKGLISIVLYFVFG